MTNSVMDLVATVGGQGTTSASAAAAAFANLTAKTTAVWVVTDGFLRIAFGRTTGVLATTASTLYAPGQTVVGIKDPLDYYSVLAPTGTPNYSISLVTVYPAYGG
jgi:hypothetical protein